MKIEESCVPFQFLGFRIIIAIQYYSLSLTYHREIRDMVFLHLGVH